MTLRAMLLGPWLLLSISCASAHAAPQNPRVANLLWPACADLRGQIEQTRSEVNIHEALLSSTPDEADALRAELGKLRSGLAKKEADYQACIDDMPPAMSEADARMRAAVEEAVRGARPKEGALAPLPPSSKPGG